jgi:hypothetical protein
MKKSLILFSMFLGCTANAAVFEPSEPVVPPKPPAAPVSAQQAESQNRASACKDIHNFIKTGLFKPLRDGKRLMAIVCDGNPEGVVDIPSAIKSLIAGLQSTEMYYANHGGPRALETVQKMTGSVQDLIAIQEDFIWADPTVFSTSTGAR